MRILVAQSRRLNLHSLKVPFVSTRRLYSSMSTGQDSQPRAASSSKDKVLSSSAYPISGVVGIVKPTGTTSMALLESLKPLLASSKVFQANPSSDDSGRGRYKKRKWRGAGSDALTPKIGQGGTLDPLAEGVLVIGIGAGTKQLQQYLHCTKHYRTVGLLGASTISYDSQDPVLERKPFAHVNAELVKEKLAAFRGKQLQVPPLFSAVRVEGKRLMEYAREGVPLPKPIESRPIEVHALTLTEWLPAGTHEYKPPTNECSEEERKTAFQARRLAGLTEDEEATPTTDTSESSDAEAPAFQLDMTVSSGTYVRCIVHDVAAKAKSAAHVVKLTRTRQGKWTLPGFAENDASETAEKVLESANGGDVKADQEKLSERKEAIEWDVLQRAIDRHAATKQGAHKRRKGEDSVAAEIDVARAASTDESGLEEWERLFLERMDIC